MQRNGDMSPEFKRLQSLVFGILDKGQQEIIGTGFLITMDGVALTASHVVSEYSMDDLIFTNIPNEGIAVKKLYVEPITDIAVLWAGHSLDQVKAVPCKTDFNGGREHLVVGFHRQFLFQGAVPCNLSTDYHNPIREIIFTDGGCMKVLVLIPHREADSIQPGMSGAPVMDVRDNKIVGLIVGTAKHLIEIGLIEEIADVLRPGNEGFATSFDRAFLQTKPFRHLISGETNSFNEILRRFNSPQHWEKIGKEYLNGIWLIVSENK